MLISSFVSFFFFKQEDKHFFSSKLYQTLLLRISNKSETTDMARKWKINIMRNNHFIGVYNRPIMFQHFQEKNAHGTTIVSTRQKKQIGNPKTKNPREDQSRFLPRKRCTIRP